MVAAGRRTQVVAPGARCWPFNGTKLRPLFSIIRIRRFILAAMKLVSPSPCARPIRCVFWVSLVSLGWNRRWVFCALLLVLVFGCKLSCLCFTHVPPQAVYLLPGMRARSHVHVWFFAWFFFCCTCARVFSCLPWCRARRAVLCAR